MSKKINELLFSKRNMFIIEGKKSKTVSDGLFKSFVVSCVQLGYRLDTELIEALRSLSSSAFKKMSVEILDILKKAKGADVDMSNFLFPNFPNQTRMTDLETLSELRFVGYIADFLGWVTDDPNYRRFVGLGKYASTKEKRTPLEIDMETLEVLKLGTYEDFYEVTKNLLGSRMPLTPHDKALLTDVVYEVDEPIRLIPEEIPFKETLAFLIQLNRDKNFNLKIQMKSFYDVKRAYAALIDSDITLKSNFYLKNLKNQDRKWLFLQMEKGMKYYEESMIESSYKERKFIKLFWNRIHPESFKAIAPKSVELLKRIRQGEKIQTLNSKIEEAILKKDVIRATELAITNPGNAMRRCLHLLSISSKEDASKILELLSTVADKVDTSVLLNLRETIIQEPNTKWKVAFPKGQANKAQLYLDYKPIISEEVLIKAKEMVETAICKRLASKEKLGKVYFEDSLEKIHVPFGLRDSSKGYRTLARGSRISLENTTDFLRFFVYKQNSFPIFVDLSVSFLNETFDLINQCSWTNLKNKMAMHSGDGSDCVEGLSEFVDVDLTKVKENEQIRYIALQVYSYNHVTFSKMPRCFVGVMERKGIMTDTLLNGKNFSRLSKEEQEKIVDFTGEVFEPSTVKSRIDLTSNGLVALPLMYDVLTEELIYTDLEVSTSNKRQILPTKLFTKGNIQPIEGSLTIENLHDNIAISCYAVVHLSKPNLKDLILLNLKAREGTRVSSKEEADIIIAEDGDISPFMSDIFTKDWL